MTLSSPERADGGQEQACEAAPGASGLLNTLHPGEHHPLLWKAERLPPAQFIQRDMEETPEVEGIWDIDAVLYANNLNSL